MRRERRETEEKKGKRTRGQGEREEREKNSHWVTLERTGAPLSLQIGNWRERSPHLSSISYTVVFPGNQIALIEEGK